MWNDGFALLRASQKSGWKGSSEEARFTLHRRPLELLAEDPGADRPATDKTLDGPNAIVLFGLTNATKLLH